MHFLHYTLAALSTTLSLSHARASTSSLTDCARARVINRCPHSVFLWSVASHGHDVDGPYRIGRDEEYVEGFIDGGAALEIFRHRRGHRRHDDDDGRLVFRYDVRGGGHRRGYHRRNKVFYELYDVGGNPFERRVVRLRSDDDSCPRTTLRPFSPYFPGRHSSYPRGEPAAGDEEQPEHLLEGTSHAEQLREEEQDGALGLAHRDHNEDDDDDDDVDTQDHDEVDTDEHEDGDGDISAAGFHGGYDYDHHRGYDHHHGFGDRMRCSADEDLVLVLCAEGRGYGHGRGW